MTQATRKPKLESIVNKQRLKHGYVVRPLSRAYWCAQNGGCGSASNEPQSVEAPKGWPAATSPGGRPTPPDGQLASGGRAGFSALDGLTTPQGTPWPATAFQAGQVARMRWWLTAPHRTSRWTYYITRDGWDPDQPLSRAQFEDTPFCNFEWSCPGGFWTCNQPIPEVHHWVYMPPGKTGRHVIYAIWTVADTDNAFYQVMDVQLEAAEGAGE